MCNYCKRNGFSPELEEILHSEYEGFSNLASEGEYPYASTIAKSPYVVPVSQTFSTAPSYTKSTSETASVKTAIANGERNENTLTDMLFYNRHPELGRRLLVRGQINFDSLSKEWIVIRDSIVRPALTAPATPPGNVYVPVPPSAPAPPPPASIQILRSNMVSVALGEWARWNYGQRKEYESQMRPVLAQYWREGVGEERSDLGTAWSGAFISWVVRKAGGGSNFRYSGAHTTYTYYAKLNRTQNNSNPFKAYRVWEIRPQVGDIVVKNQEGHYFSYDNLQPDRAGTHGDIVVKVNPGSIEITGGNLSNSVNKNTLSLNPSGYISKQEYFAIIRVGGASPSELQNRRAELNVEMEWDINPEFASALTGEEEFNFEQEISDSSFLSKIANLPSSVFSLLQTGKEIIALKTAIQNGLRDENDLTNLIFFNRHPELNGKKLVKTQPGFESLSKEWLQIRDLMVRPQLTSIPPGTTTPAGHPDMPPVETPLNLKPITGYRCASGRKCWKGPKSADIVDADAPWNKPGNRSAANYIAVLDYFNVGESDSVGKGNSILKPGENPRYQQQKSVDPKDGKTRVSTYCNIYVHDVTRAMWASIPHWIPTGRKNELNELNANDTVTWLLSKGKENGWIQINKEMTDWISAQISSGKAIAAPNSFYSFLLSRAGSQVALTPGINPSLIAQPAYTAQQFANLGLPTVAVWQNRGGIGHVAMIRPEEGNKKGTIESGMFRPRSAQAGAVNFSSGPLVFGASSLKGGAILFFVHE